MENKFYLLEELLHQKKYAALRQELSRYNEIDTAAFMEILSAEQATVVFRLLSKERAAEVFANLESDTKEIIISSVTDKELGEIVEELYVDDAVDMLEELPANMVKRVLKNATADTRSLINQFLNYPENSAGSIMTAEFIDLRQNMTVSEAISHIRKVGEQSEQIYTCYVINSCRVLEGVVTVKELLLASDDCTVGQLMTMGLVTAATLDDRESVGRTMMKYDLLAMPVVDLEGRLVGIVTIDDVMDVMQEEVTEDFEKMAAMAPSERPYLKTGVLELARNRIMWLLVLMISGMITGSILGRYETAFATLPLLVTFIPMLTDTGGNAGSQSSTLIIRGMALGDICRKDFFKVFWKELQVSLLVGAALSAVNFVRLFISYGSVPLALTVAGALFATVVTAKTVGGLLPILASFFHVDPAIMAAPLITTIVDVVSLVIYFSIAQVLLPIY